MNILSFPSATATSEPVTAEPAPIATPTPKRRGPAASIDRRNLVLRDGKYTFRRMISGRIETFALETADVRVAAAKAEAHRRATDGKSAEEIFGLTRKRDLASFEDALAAFLKESAAHGKRPATLTGYAAIGRIFAKDFPGRAWQKLTPEAFETWVRKKYANPTSAASLVRHVLAVARWSSKEGMLNNPALIAYEHKTPITDTVVEYLAIEEAKKLLHAGAHADLPPVILGLFAGIRPDEVARMKWSDIKWDEKRIFIRAECSKVRVARNIEGVPEALWRHLAPYRPREGYINPMARNAVERTRSAAKLERWPFDALRHTFATFYCAHTGNPGVVAGILGHASLRMLQRHYNGVATRAEAEKYFAL